MTESSNPAIGRPSPQQLKADLGFDLLPADYADPACIKASLGIELSNEALARLRRSPRSRSALSAALRRRFRLRPCRLGGLPEPDRRLLQSGPEELFRVIRLAGAAWIGGYLMKIITAEELRPVLAVLGREAYDFALANPDLSSGLGFDFSPDTLDQTLDWLGVRCVLAWSASQHPAAVFARLRLMFPPSEAVERPPTAHEKMFGPRILRRILEETIADARN